MNGPEAPRSTVTILRELLADPRNQEAFGDLAAKLQPRIKEMGVRRWGLQDADADDLTATILLGFFERDVFSDFVLLGREKFYGWLNVVVKRAVLTFLRNRERKPDAWSVGNTEAQNKLQTVTQEMVHDLGTLCEAERTLLRAARGRVEARVEAKTREVFHLLADEERPVKEVAEQLHMTEFAVWKARSRVLRMLRDEVRHQDGRAGQAE